MNKEIEESRAAKRKEEALVKQLRTLTDDLRGRGIAYICVVADPALTGMQVSHFGKTGHLVLMLSEMVGQVAGAISAENKSLRLALKEKER